MTIPNNTPLCTTRYRQIHRLGKQMPSVKMSASTVKQLNLQ
jgi:hypothetical protein